MFWMCIFDVGGNIFDLYASGCVWSYTCIDEGYEGMQKKHINQGN